LKLSSFVPRPTIKDDEINGYQELAFYIDTTNPANVSFEVGDDFVLEKNSAGNYVPKNAEPYSASRIDRELSLGSVQQWELRSYFVSHPFHIHVNPFQIVKIIDPNGKDVSVAGAVTTRTRAAPTRNIPVCRVSGRTRSGSRARSPRREG